MHRRFLISRFFIVCIGFVLSEIQIVAAESFPQVRFTPLPSDILPSNEVRKLYQDSDGYIWIPTYNGLARYDGYGAITFRTGCSTRSSMSLPRTTTRTCGSEPSTAFFGSTRFRETSWPTNIQSWRIATSQSFCAIRATASGSAATRAFSAKMRSTVIFIPSRSPIRRVVPSRRSPPSSRMTN